MDRTRRRALWWLLGCVVIAAVLAAMTANRVYNARQLEAGGGANEMSAELMSQAVQSLTLAAVFAVAGLLPAAWIGLRGRAAVHVVHAPRSSADVPS